MQPPGPGGRTGTRGVGSNVGYRRKARANVLEGEVLVLKLVSVD